MAMTMSLRDYLADKNLTSDEFAKIIGVEGATVRRYLDGSRLPRPEIQAMIEVKTGGLVTPNDLLRAWRQPPRKRGARKSECRATG